MSVWFSLSVWCNCTFTAFKSLKTALNAIFFSVKYLSVLFGIYKNLFYLYCVVKRTAKQRFLTINLMHYETI